MMMVAIRYLAENGHIEIAKEFLDKGSKQL